MDINPWQVDNIQEFYFLKCPECDFMHKEKSDFQNHAVENHPLSVTFFGEVNMRIEKIGIFFCTKVFLILAFKIVASRLGFVPTKSIKSDSSMPLIEELKI